MTLARLCECGSVVPVGVSSCSVCARERLPDRLRRQANNRRLGRRGAGGHWRKLSLLARQLQPYCSVPGESELKLPAPMVDVSRAESAGVRVKTSPSISCEVVIIALPRSTR